MIPNRKTILAISATSATIALALFFALGFRDSGNEPYKPLSDTVYSIQSFKLPDEVIFAGERMPLENFDTRESLEREILTSAYRHSSTILIIKRANRYLPVIEKILKENNIPDDFKYLVAAESEYSNMISPAGAMVSPFL